MGDALRSGFALQMAARLLRHRMGRGVKRRDTRACENSGYVASDHFTHEDKVVSLGSRVQHENEDFRRSRYTCYLVVLSSDPSQRDREADTRAGDAGDDGEP
jgi:DNA-damage-inducible protein D